MSKHEIAEVVRRHARSVRFADIEIQVDEEGVSHDGDWWYVPVRPVHAFRRTDLYYAFLADLEEDVDEEEGLNILLVPCAALEEAATAA